MKIKKLENNNKLTFYDLVDKVNEIIELLNNSFITNDPDTIYGEVTDSSINISCDRLTPLSNETTCELTVEHLLNIIEGDSLYAGIECPKCGAKHFEVGPSNCTAVYYPTIIKDGVSINPERNSYTTSYTCCECGHRWEETK